MLGCSARVGNREKNPLHRTAFSMAALTVTSLVAGLVYREMGGTLASMAPGLVGLEKPIAAAATTYFLINTLLVTTAVGLETRQPLRKIWNEHIVWSALGYFVGGGVAALGVFLVPGAGIWLAPLLIVPLYLTFSTYRLYFERMDTDQQRLRELSNLHLATIEALALAIDAKDQTATSHIRRVQIYASGIAEAMGMAGERDRGAQDGRPAPRHREARGSRTHPLEARPAHPGGVPADEDSSAGGRRDPRERAVPLSRRAAGALPPRTVGRQGISRRA